MKYIFDDGSLESKVLQHEIRDAQVFKVKPYTTLDNWLSEIIEEDDEIKFVYLHFCQGDLIRQDVDIRTEIATATHNYPQLRIILRYEQMDRPGLERRAANYNIRLEPKSDVDEILEANKDKIKTIDYGKYRVGGDVDVTVKGGDYNYETDPFKQKSEQFKDKRRRKKKTDE